MSDGVSSDAEGVSLTMDNVYEPTREQKLQMRKAVKRPSEWLRRLCRDWAIENEALVEACDEKFIDYKPYMKGMLTSQLLCRLSIPVHKEPSMDNSSGNNSHGHHVDFWRILGIVDEFDKSYIIAQIERFCAIYNIRGLPEENESIFGTDLAAQDAASMATAAAAGISVSPSGGIVGIPSYIDPQTAAAAAAAAAAVSATSPSPTHAPPQPPPPQVTVTIHPTAAGAAPIPTAMNGLDAANNRLTKKQATEVSRAQRMAKDAEKALEQERRQNLKKEQKRMSQERKEQKQREREAQAMRKAQERSQREASREDRRKKKLDIRLQRETFAQEQKELALKRAAELVASNRVPIEITRGAAAAKAAASAALAAGGHQPPPEPVVPLPSKKPRSAIVVSTAKDLHQIVTHSKNLWAKYNAIAKEHNQKVNWITVAKELGIHVKVREKYARMHSRAEQRGFDWEKCGHWKIKDHPEIFIEPTESEQKAKMPLPPPDSSTTVLVAGTKEISHLNAVLEGNNNNGDNDRSDDQSHDSNSKHDISVTDEAVAAAARVVDASGVTQPMAVDNFVSPSAEQTAAAAAVAATMVADPTANFAPEESLHELRAQTI